MNFYYSEVVQYLEGEGEGEGEIQIPLEDTSIGECHVRVRASIENLR